MNPLKVFSLAILIVYTISAKLTAQALYVKEDEKTGLVGLADENDKWILKPTYKEMDFNITGEGTSVHYVKDKKDKIGFVNARGVEVIKCQFDAYYEEDGLYLTEIRIGDTESKHGIVDLQGKEIVPARYSFFYNTSKQGGFVLQDPVSHSYGVIDVQGKTVIPFTYPYISYIHKGIVIAQTENPGKQGLLNLQNKVVVPYSYDIIGEFSDGSDIAAVAKDGKMGYMDMAGKIVIPMDYDYVVPDEGFYSPPIYWSRFIDGYAAAKKGGKWGIIDSSNKVIEPFKYDDVDNHTGTKFTFMLKNEKVVVDAKQKAGK